MTKNWGIKYKVMTLSVLPTLIIAISLAVFFIYTRSSDLQNNLEIRAKTIARQLAYSSEFGLTTGNKVILNHLAQLSQQDESDLLSLMVFDINNQPSLPSRNAALTKHLQWPHVYLPTEEQMVIENQSFLIYEPILSHSLPISERDIAKWLQGGGNEVILGYVVVEMSTASTQLASYRSFFNSFMIVLLSIGLSSLLVLRLSKTVTSPIITMAKAVTKIKQGQLSTRVSTQSSGELKILNDGINTMVATMEHAQDEMALNIKQATADITQTLETIEVQNIELDIARKQAQEASRTKSEFLANVSHEIRTPMNGVIGFCNLLAKTELSVQQQEYLNTIRKSSRGLLTIIDDILDFSKIEAGKMEMESHSVSLRNCLEDTLTMLAPAASEKNIELVGLVYQDIPEKVEGDSLRISQILTNLVNNAIKFSEDGSIVVRIMLEQEMANNILVKVVVSDSGVGLASAQKEKLFQSFTQADTSTTRKYGGTGLGLAICKKLVNTMGGKVGINSIFGKGSDFWFTLKLPIVERTTVKISPLQWQNKLALIYEPHKIANLVTTHYLQSWGFKTQSFESRASFFNALKKLPQSMNMLSDETTPLILISTKRGDKVIEDFKGWLTVNNEVPIKFIVLSAQNDYLDSIKASSGNFDNTLTKPIVSKRFFNLLEHIFPPRVADIIDESSLSAKQKNNIQDLQILIVDDNDSNLKLLDVLLSEKNINTTLANNGLQAVEYAKQKNFDLILMDVQMPEMDGKEATKLIRNKSLNVNTPIIAVTAHAMKGEKEALITTGMDDYLSKPIDENQLASCLERWLSLNNRLLTNSSIEQLEESQESIDIDACIRLANGKKNLAKDLLNMLYNSLTSFQNDISTAIEEKNDERIQQIVHKLHGASCYSGVPHLKALCQKVQDNLKSMEEDEKKYQLIDKLQQAILDIMEDYPRKIHLLS
ncbi:MAG: hypothetical protein COW84_09825 [Gammaproteobacteria bacterium CG22_combo_CG10-13_8_21_14_all_40_8]|nr:MAG: hypothetical protein COW84_09825 [Gammaproteobacteria bacterium CG22_combo_CG10-13_8_21_14_all_40_8]